MAVAPPPASKLPQFHVRRNFDGKQFLPRKIVQIAGNILFFCLPRDVQLPVELTYLSEPSTIVKRFAIWKDRRRDLCLVHSGAFSIDISHMQLLNQCCWYVSAPKKEQCELMWQWHLSDDKDKGVVCDG